MFHFPACAPYIHRVPDVIRWVSPFRNFRVKGCLAPRRNLSQPYHVFHRSFKPRHPPYTLTFLQGMLYTAVQFFVAFLLHKNATVLWTSLRRQSYDCQCTEGFSRARADMSSHWLSLLAPSALRRAYRKRVAYVYPIDFLPLSWDRLGRSLFEKYILNEVHNTFECRVRIPTYSIVFVVSCDTTFWCLLGTKRPEHVLYAYSLDLTQQTTYVLRFW